MKTHIEKKLYIESDDKQFILREYSNKKDKDGNTVIKSSKYFGKLDSVFKELFSRKVKESTATNLKELLEDINRIDKWIEDKFKGV